MPHGIKQFTEEKEQEIIKIYPKLPNKKICELFGCGNSWLEAFVTKHKLRKEKVNKDEEFKDLKIGKLKVIKRLDKKEKNNWIWLCQCECGNTKQVRASNLRYQKTKDCGCETRKKYGVNHHNRKGYGNIGGTQWSKIVSHAVERGIEFKITPEYAWKLALEQNLVCVLSGEKLIFPEKYSDTKSNASLDRKDSSKPYEEGNVQWILKEINFMKHTLSESRFKELCKKISNNIEQNTYIG